METVQEKYQQAITKLLLTGTYSKNDLIKIYKLLCKNTHPDLTGKDGKDFIKLQEIYQQAQEKFVKNAEGAINGFDPYEVIRDAGCTERYITTREALYFSLYRYYKLGLYSFRIRSNKSLKIRNMKIVRAILYWGYQYDEKFVGTFIDFNKNVFQFSHTTMEMKNYMYAKKLFTQGLHNFFYYQRTGKEISKEVSLERFSLSERVLKHYVNISIPLIPFLSWFINELDKPPILCSDSHFS